uniref:Uncharacterized protein n=1 Tax=Arion vulgaris TaxID=1028688 RepID=A0A0B6YTC8_9EUPU
MKNLNTNIDNFITAVYFKNKEIKSEMNLFSLKFAKLKLNVHTASLFTFCYESSNQNKKKQPDAQILSKTTP